MGGGFLAAADRADRACKRSGGVWSGRGSGRAGSLGRLGFLAAADRANAPKKVRIGRLGGGPGRGSRRGSGRGAWEGCGRSLGGSFLSAER